MKLVTKQPKPDFDNLVEQQSYVTGGSAEYLYHNELQWVQVTNGRKLINSVIEKDNYFN